jgi:hypothetical protein
MAKQILLTNLEDIEADAFERFFFLREFLQLLQHKEKGVVIKSLIMRNKKSRQVYQVNEVRHQRICSKLSARVTQVRFSAF